MLLAIKARHPDQTEAGAGMVSLSQGLCAEIRAYLAAHPDAADSVEGIRQWWLPDSLAHVSLVVLRQALDRMVRRAELRRMRLPDGSDLYAAPDPSP